jgi:hypothetical protein
MEEKKTIREIIVTGDYLLTTGIIKELSSYLADLEITSTEIPKPKKPDPISIKFNPKNYPDKFLDQPRNRKERREYKKLYPNLY